MVKFSIFQIKDIADTKYAFRDWCLAKDNFSISDYKNVYSDKIDIGGKTSLDYICEDLFCKFNRTDFNKVPDDFKGHSLSVSDVIVFEEDSKVSVWYCDGIGFVEITDTILKKLFDICDNN